MAWKWMWRLSILFLLFFIIIATIYFGFYGVFKDPVEIDKTDSFLSIFMSPANAFASIFYKGLFNCQFAPVENLSEKCFTNYKISLSLSFLPGMLSYFLVGLIIGLIIDKAIEHAKRPKNLVEEVLR